MNAKDRKQRSTGELQRASKAVQYEMVSMVSTHEMLQELAASGASSPRDQAMSNALLNSFLLAARSLLSFLYAHEPRLSDIIAEDFFSDPDEWRNRRLVPEPEMESGELKSVISKWLAHLTWDRVDSARPLWGPFRITLNIALVMQCFVELVDKVKLHRVLREDTAHIVSRLRAQRDKLGAAASMIAPMKEFIRFDDLRHFGP